MITCATYITQVYIPLWVAKSLQIASVSMGKFMVVNISFLWLCIAFLHFVQSQEEAHYPWPKPWKTMWRVPGSVPLSRDFKIIVPGHKYLEQSALSYSALVMKEKWHPITGTPSTDFNIVECPGFSDQQICSKCDNLDKMVVTVHDLHADLQHGVDESYVLEIPPSGGSVNLTSGTPWGAMRGLETFSQLVYNSKGSLVCRTAFIEDHPLYTHRGLLLDTARNFYPVSDIMRTVRALSYNKMNVLHWHITDSQSFPLDLEREPELSRKGAYSDDRRYSIKDVAAIVEYAKFHGVRVIPEIDTPGHAASWAGAYPGIVTCAGMFWDDPTMEPLAAEPCPGQLNPLNPKTYKVVQNVIEEVASLFPDNFFHAGGDEVTPGCWKTDQDIKNILTSGGTLSQILEEYIIKTREFVVGANKTVVYWEDVLLDNTVKVKAQILPKESTVLQTWNNGPDNTKKITSLGYRVIVSSADYYYLDCGHGGWLGNDSRYVKPPSGDSTAGSWCAPFKTWQNIYNYDITKGLTKAEAQLVVGGEVALWSEQSDAVGMDSRIWPRTSALAESMWSGNRGSNGERRYADAMQRIHQWRFRMVGRGINAEALQPLWCLKNPGMCNRNQ